MTATVLPSLFRIGYANIGNIDTISTAWLK